MRFLRFLGSIVGSPRRAREAYALMEAEIRQDEFDMSMERFRTLIEEARRL